MVTAYCLKEKKKNVTIQNPHYDLNKIGRPICRGTCSSCGGKVQAILSADNTPADLKDKAAKFKAAHKKGGAKSRSRSKSNSAGKRRKSRSRGKK